MNIKTPLFIFISLFSHSLLAANPTTAKKSITSISHWEVEEEIKGHFSTFNEEQTFSLMVEVANPKSKQKSASKKSEEEQLEEEEQESILADKNKKIALHQNGKIIFENTEFIPCGNCLGVSGGFVSLELHKATKPLQFDSFSILLESGGGWVRDHYSYTFRFDPASKKFLMIGEDNKPLIAPCDEVNYQTSINYLTGTKIVTTLKCKPGDEIDFIPIGEKRSKVITKPIYLETASDPFSSK